MISIVIPVYNTEAYLPHCLESILAQSDSDWRCICVDDGSTDASAQIVESYVQRDRRFSLIRQENRGVSAARNVALRQLSAGYVTFLDSDDYLHPRMIELMRRVAEETKADCVACRPVLTPRVAVEPLVDVGERLKDVEHVEQPVRYILRETPPNFSCCGKLYRQQSIAGVLFPEGMSFEDGPWLLEALDHVEKMVSINLPLISFYERELSATRSSWNEQKTRDILASIRYFMTLQPRGDREVFRETMHGCVAHWVRVLLYHIRTEPSKQRRRELWRDAIPQLRAARRAGFLPMSQLKIRHRVALCALLLGVLIP